MSNTQDAKKLADKLLSFFECGGHVYADTHNGNIRLLIEKCNADEATRLKIKARIRRDYPNAQIYL